jgi:hypothetical protein
MNPDAIRSAADNREALTWDEICSRFPNEWVVLVDIGWVSETDFDFTTAAVIAHHQHRRAASPAVKAARARNAEAGCFWTGEIRAPVPRVFMP